MNLSTVDDDTTARTDPECAMQRAEHLASLGVRTVLELCVGPSLRELEEAYKQHGIVVTGNDIDERWKHYYPKGSWVIGDALAVEWSTFDAVVFAPPLSRGCSGRREDALRISEVVPSYRSFVDRLSAHILAVLVLPARAKATREDRTELFQLVSSIPCHNVEAIDLTAGRRRVRKYTDLYLIPRYKRAP